MRGLCSRYLLGCELGQYRIRYLGGIIPGDGAGIREQGGEGSGGVGGSEEYKIPVVVNLLQRSLRFLAGFGVLFRVSLWCFL